MSRQHILPPACRTMDRARGIALKLLHQIARRMRTEHLWAGGVYLQVGLKNGRALQMGTLLPPTQDTLTLQSHFLSVWRDVPGETPTDLTIALTAAQPVFRGG